MRLRATTRAPRAAAALLAATLVAASCTAPGPAPASPGTPSASGGASGGGRVVIGSIVDARTLDPILVNDLTSAEVSARLYESLVAVDAKTGAPVARLAERYEVSPDGRTLTFVLRDGLLWSDGSALTGDDFRFTLEATLRSKATPRKNALLDIEGAKDYADGRSDALPGVGVDGRTITVRLSRASCPALVTVGGVRIIPRAEFGRYADPKDASKNVDDAAENLKPVLSAGPFRFKEWVRDDHVTLVRNDRFSLGKPRLDEWVMKVYPNGAAAAGALRAGEIDALVASSPEEAESLKQVGSLRLYSYLTAGYTFIGWNELRGGKEFFQDRTVRQALAYALDVDAVISTSLSGEGRRMVAHSLPGSWVHDDAGLEPYRYDPGRAEQLLRDDGWSKGADGVYAKGGRKLEFTMVTNSGNAVREALLNEAVADYRKIGVNVVPRTESFDALVDRVMRSRDPVYGDQGGHDFDAAIVAWSLGPDPDAFAIWHSSQVKGGDFVGYRSDAADRALEAGRTMCSTDDRRAAYQKLDQQLNQDQPYAFAFAPNTLLFVSAKISGVDPGPFATVGWNVERWSIAP